MQKVSTDRQTGRQASRQRRGAGGDLRMLELTDRDAGIRGVGGGGK